MSAPCKDCGSRYVGCHGECKAYQEFRAGKDKELAEKYVAGDWASYQAHRAVLWERGTRHPANLRRFSAHD